MVQKEALVDPFHRSLRVAASEFLTATKLPIEVSHNPQSEKLLHLLMGWDYGIIEVTNHWGLMEFPSVLAYNFTNRDLRRAKTLLPFAAHKYKEKYAKLGNHVSTKLMPTATPDSDEYYQKESIKPPEDYDQLNERFIEKAAVLLKSGGVVLFSPLGKRVSELPEKFEKRMTATFMIGLQKNGVDFSRIAFLFVGTGLKGVTDYAEWKDVEWGEKHPPVEVRIGDISVFDDEPFEGRILSKADRWARDNLAKVVPESYLPKVPQRGHYKI